MTDDRAEFTANRDAGLVKRHEQRLARATETPKHDCVGDENYGCPACIAEGAPERTWQVPDLARALRETVDAARARRLGSAEQAAPHPRPVVDREAADTKALVETATRLATLLALEEAAKIADDLAAGVGNPEKPYNDAFIHACGVVARHIRERADQAQKAL